MITEQISILYKSHLNQDFLMIACVAGIHLNHIDITNKLAK